MTIGYTFLIRRCWGAGFNLEMKRLMLEHALQYVDRVFFEIGRDNFRSRRAIEKIGATLDSELTLDGNPYCRYRIDG